MKKLETAFLLLFVTHAVMGKTITFNSLKSEDTTLDIQRDSHEITLNLDINRMDTFEEKATPLGEGFSSLYIRGMKNTAKPGYPSLPFHSFLVSAPIEDLEVSYDYQEMVKLKNIKSLPAPLKPCRCSETKEELYPLFENSYYQNEEDNLIELVSLGDYRGQKITKVIVRPILSAGGDLKVFRDLRVNIRSEKTLHSIDVAAKNKLLVIAAPTSLMNGAKELAQYKANQGYKVTLKFFDDEALNRAEVKKYFHDQYKKSAYSFAIIVGHEGEIAPDRVITTSDAQTPSDFPYFTMGGAGDAIPDVFYGRIVASTNDDIRRQISKFKEFEKGTWNNSYGSDKVVGIASDEGWNPTDIDYLASMLNPLANAFQFQVVNFHQGNSDSNPTEINRALNEGAIWLNYIGHGSGDSWSSITQGEYSSAHVAELSSEVVKPVIIDVACQNGRFNNNERLGEVFQKSFDGNGPTGSVAFYGGSVDISWDPPAVMAVAINEKLAQGVDQDLFSLIMTGQLHLLESYDDIEAAKENLLWYHLLGDPSLRVNSLSW